MTIETLEKYILDKNKSNKSFSFGDDVVVFKVINKIFALYGIKDNKINLNLKCEPNDAIAFRDIYTSVIPAYHMNKKHWNTIILDNSMKNKILQDMIDDSYNLIISKLSKKDKLLLNNT